MSKATVAAYARRAQGAGVESIGATVRAASTGTTLSAAEQNVLLRATINSLVSVVGNLVSANR